MPPLRRHIPLDKTFNTRDVGGYRARDGRYTRWGALLRSDCPYALSAESLRTLAGLDLRTALDLRNGQEIRDEDTRNALSRSGSVCYINEPLMTRFGPDTLTDWLGEAYVLYLDRCRDRIRVLLGVLAREPWPAMINCQAGKDRTGVLVALVLALAGVSDDDIVADYALTEHFGRDLIPLLIDEAIRLNFDSPRYRHMLETRPDGLRFALDWARRNFGSLEGYAHSIGVTDVEIKALCDKLLVERTEVAFGWRLPDERRARTPFVAEVHVYEASLDRWLMRLVAPAEPVDPALPEEFRARIEALGGAWVRVPGEARANRLTLPMKYETLLGSIAYFHETRPAIAP